MGQCPGGWLSGAAPVSDEIYALSTWDPDGPGPSPPRLLAAGVFQSSGGTPLNFVGSWDGVAWSPLGSGLSTTGEVICWPPSSGSTVAGSGVYVGGFFSTAGSSSVHGIARWDGTAWYPLDLGVGGISTSDVRAIGAFGSNLYVAGGFTTAGGTPANFIARWDGTAWHALPDERAGAAWVLTVIDGQLYAGGYFPDPGPFPPVAGVLRWTGQTWLNVGDNVPRDTVFALTRYRGQIIAGGSFENLPGDHIAAFDGTHWQPLGIGVSYDVRALCPFDPDGPGPMPELLIVGGHFALAGGQPSPGIAAWDGANWMPLGSGMNGAVKALAVYNNQLAVGGSFTTAGGQPSPYFALWGCPQPAPCYPNCDQSTTLPILNINDFVCFLNAFVAGSPYANCDNSTRAPTLNILDFICFLNKFAAGCS